MVCGRIYRLLFFINTFKKKMITTQSFINLINETTKKYYSNPYSFKLNNKELSKQYWKDHNTKKLPYSKGSLIAFLIHLNISKLSEETKNLDDFMKIIISESKNVLINDSTLLLGLKKVVKYKKWDDFYKDYILGVEELPIKELSIFGFELINLEESYFDLGFETNDGKIEKDAIICKVIQGTNASKIGLKKGDLLEGLSIYYGNIEKEVILNIIRDNEKLNFKYYPVKKSMITQIDKSNKNEKIIEKYLLK